MKSYVALVIFMLALPLTLLSQRETDSFETGNDFLRQCDEAKLNRSNTVAAAQYMHCMGYIQGFLEGHTVLVAVSGAKPSYCYPENVDIGQVRRLVMKSLRENPEKTHLPISVLLEKALIDAFPCPK